jgi:multimeric flavodoxin WrbA
MKITVFNGSPKGSKSNTVFSLFYLQNQFPQHEFSIFNVGKDINKMFRNEEDIYPKLIESVKQSDGILWVCPVYIFSVPSQLIRFIEMLYERNDSAMLAGKYAAFITTSLHVMDNFACEYMKAVSEELNMSFVASFTAETTDILLEKERKKLLPFAEYFFNAITNKYVYQKQYTLPTSYVSKHATDLSHSFPKIETAKKVIIIKDNNTNETLNSIVGVYHGFFRTEPEMIDVTEIEIKGGCYGCLFCGFDNTCIYDFGGKDKFTEYFNGHIRTADVIVFAATISHGNLSGKMKQFLDRIFFNNHTQPLKGKQVVFILDGIIIHVPYIRQILEGFAEIQAANLAGMISADGEDEKSFVPALYRLASDSMYFSEAGYVKPQGFLGVGAHKVLRDNVYGYYRKILCADYFYFRKNKMFDFPKRNFFQWLHVSAILLLNNFMLFRKVYYKGAHQKGMKKLNKAVGNKAS